MMLDVLKRLIDWFEEQEELLDKAVRGHGDFYRASVDTMLSLAPAYNVPPEELLLIIQAYGYYELALQVPGIVAIHERMPEREREREQHLPEPIGDGPPSLLALFRDLQLWRDVYKQARGIRDEKSQEVNPEVVALFTEKHPE